MLTDCSVKLNSERSFLVKFGIFPYRINFLYFSNKKEEVTYHAEPEGVGDLYDQLDAIPPAEVRGLDPVSVGVGPVESPRLVVDAQTVRPAQILVDDRHTIAAVQRSPLNLGRHSPV